MSPPTPSSVLVGIVAANRKDKTLHAVRSVVDSIGEDLSIYLVDNGSEDDIGRAVEESYPDVLVKRTPSNLGASGGRNLIVDHFLEGSWDYLVFMDNDVVLRQDSIKALVESARQLLARGAKVGCIGAHLVYRDRPEVFWSAGGGRIDWNRGWFYDTGQGENIREVYLAPRQVDTAPTALLLATRDGVAAAGHFIDEYKIYLEDTDWCWRMIREGFQCWTEPSAVATHDVSSSLGMCSPRFHFLRTRNRMWFFGCYGRRGKVRTRWNIVGNVLWHSCYPELRAGHLKSVCSILAGMTAGLFPPRRLRAAATPVVSHPARC